MTTFFNTVLKTEAAFTQIAQSGGPFWSTRLARLGIFYAMMQFGREANITAMRPNDRFDNTMCLFLGAGRFDILEPALTDTLHLKTFLDGCHELLRVISELTFVLPELFDGAKGTVNATVISWHGDDLCVAVEFTAKGVFHHAGDLEHGLGVSELH